MFRFVLAGAPRTKKTSQRIVQIRGKNGGRGFTKILPSEAHEVWFKAALQQVPIIRAALIRQGAVLPIENEVAIRATFFRQANVGDLLGYEQALADWMQAQKINEATGKMVRNGAGIICDDVQIVSWDGSRLHKDSSCPRIECEVSVVARPVAANLFEKAAW